MVENYAVCGEIDGRDGWGWFFRIATAVSLARNRRAVYDKSVGFLRRNCGGWLDISLGVVKMATV
jgi:hypothetical protein